MTAAISAARVAAMMQSEEEDMTPYTPSDLAGPWEFKIIRSATGKFRNPAFLAQSLAEEARAGWSLLEKFDDNRVRLKRPTSERARDAGRNLDAYRTAFGPGQGVLIAAVLGGSLALVLVVVGFVLLFAPHVR